MPDDSMPEPRYPFAGQTLFSGNFLAMRLPDHPCWSCAGLAELHQSLPDAYAAFCEVRKPGDEENTRHEWLDPVLDALGWHYDREARTRSGRADYALFAEHDDRVEAAKVVAAGPGAYYRRALTILEAN